MVENDEENVSNNVKEDVIGKVEDKSKNMFTDVKEEEVNAEEAESGKAMSVLAYLGILALIPFFFEKKNKFVVYHAKQGVNLLVLEAAWWVLYKILSLVFRTKHTVWGIAEYYTTQGWVSTVISLGSLFLAALSIIGIVYACQGKAKELPLVNKIKIIK